jgi:hypothetical protein
LQICPWPGLGRGTGEGAPDSGGVGRRRQARGGGTGRGGSSAPLGTGGVVRDGLRCRLYELRQLAADGVDGGDAPVRYGGGKRAEEDQGGQRKVLVGLI